MNRLHLRHNSTVVLTIMWMNYAKNATLPRSTGSVICRIKYIYVLIYIMRNIRRRSSIVVEVVLIAIVIVIKVMHQIRVS